ncbi:MAG: hypothetical protein GX262_11280 [Clostridia bacterium]|nr:hypothetical protein [Clostridia bacterium]
MFFIPILVPKSLLQKLALIFLGFLVGAAFTTVRMGNQIDRLIIIRQEQAEKIAGLETELQQVRTSLSRHQEPVLTSVVVKVEFIEPKPIKLEEDTVRLSLEKQIKELLNNLMGKKIDDLDPTLIPWIVENRLLEAEGYTFKIQVKLLVLTDKIHLTVSARSIPAGY